MSDKLKPCPFCGGEVKGYDVNSMYWVACAECGAKQAPSISRVSVINAWNTRKPMERIVERLEKALSYTGYIGEADYFDGLREAIKIVKEESGV